MNPTAGLLTRTTHSLTGKLVTILGLLILVGSGIFWYISDSMDRKNLMDNTVAFMVSLSETVKRSIHHDMLFFLREDIQRTVESIGASESLTGVRIFDSKGRVSYSADRTEIGQTVARDSIACSGCHKGDAKPSEVLTAVAQWTIYEEREGHRVLSFVEPIYNERDCYTAACHVHGEAQKVLGILATDFSLYPIDMRIKKQRFETSLYMLGFVLASTSLLYLILWRFVLNPVSALSRSMKKVSSGDLSQKVPVPTGDEIGRLAQTFNVMTDELAEARHKMERWTESLEEEVEIKANEIRKAQDRLLQSEKLAALGRLTADIAHEIRNPLTALGGFGRRLYKLASNEKEKEYASIVVSEVDRLEHILRDVLTFSREPKFNFERIPITTTVEEALSFFSDMCAESSIKVETDFGTELSVLIDRQQIRQAITNLIVNAIDAMPKGGLLRIVTKNEEMNDITYLAVHVLDTGPGVPQEDLELIFEPFHTTKEIGHGTGLGLSVSRKIIEEHGGLIHAENEPEGGLRVSLYFPYQGEEDLAKTPCWEFMNCGRDKDTAIKCPAYPHFGRKCWVVAGTFCEGKVQGTFAQKHEDCRKCAFFRSVQKEPA